jgi:hypothetical protein
VATNPPEGGTDIAEIGRLLIRMLLTIGGGIVFFFLVVRVCSDMWVGDEPIRVDRIYSAVTISLSITFGSAFVGWLGLSDKETVAKDVAPAQKGFRGRSAFVGKAIFRLLTSLPGAAIVAMLLYLVAGAIAGISYVLEEDEAPTVIVTVATAWAAQASAIVAATLATALKTKEERPELRGHTLPRRSDLVDRAP